MVSSMPTLYNVDNNTNEGEAVMVPVASTVIPLEDLPVFKVGLFVSFNLGFTKFEINTYDVLSYCYMIHHVMELLVRRKDASKMASRFIQASCHFL